MSKRRHNEGQANNDSVTCLPRRSRSLIGSAYGEAVIQRHASREALGVLLTKWARKNKS